MTIINIEVLDSDFIDCEYYGFSYVARRITLEKENGNISGLKRELQDRLTKVTKAHARSSELTSMIDKKNNELTSVKKSIRNARHNVSEAKRAVKALHTDFDVTLLEDKRIGEMAKTRNALQTELDALQAERQKQLAKEQTAQNSAEYSDFEHIVDEIAHANQIKYKKLTLSDIFNSTLGSTYLYDRLLLDGWKIKANANDTINHIVLGDSDISKADVIEHKSHDISVEKSQYEERGYMRSAVK